MKAITLEWLEYAEADIKSCENNIKDKFLTNIVAFHSQQTVEKIFKALLEEKEIAIPRIHNLTRLFALIEDYLIEPIDIVELDALDNVYINSRYPGDIGLIATGKPSISESKELYEIALKIFNIVLKSI